MITRNVKKHELSKSQTHIAQVVSSYTEPLGITDRKLLEQITNEAIRRLEGILPGMEHLVLPENKRAISHDPRVCPVVYRLLLPGTRSWRAPVKPAQRTPEPP